jgi:hypothetical protein
MGTVPALVNKRVLISLVTKQQCIDQFLYMAVLTQVGIFMSDFHFSHELKAHVSLVMSAMKHAAFMSHVLQ